MLGEVKLAADIALSTAGLAVPAGAQLAFDVEEEGMLVEFHFKGYLDTAATTVEHYLRIDDDAAAPAAEGRLNASLANTAVEFTELRSLSKGRHKVELLLEASAATTLTGATDFPACLRVRRLSNDSLLAHGVNSKDKGVF